jgi:glucose-6-phosphate isomerase
MTHNLLQDNATRLLHTGLSALFAQDPERAARFAYDFNDWRVDVSRHLINDETLSLLHTHAETLDLHGWLAALFAGERLNITENRAALHTALRQQTNEPLYLGKKNVLTLIRDTQNKMKRLAETLRGDGWLGATGKPIKTVVQLGVGGSCLGTRLICDALVKPYDFDVRFVANLDENALTRTIARLDPETTLFIAVSKTFTTEEVTVNAKAAKAWLASKIRDNDTLHSRHFIAVTANADAARSLGIPDDNILPIWDWVGGRYSLWSAVSLALPIQCGWDVFTELLRGAADIDDHTKNAAVRDNIPMTLALIDWYNATFLDRRARVIAPYAQALARLPEHLQQLFLESNGKAVDWDGVRLDPQAPSVGGVFGGMGTDAQHTYFQWLHQGIHRVNLEFIIPAHVNGKAQRPEYLAHALAQPQALMQGQDADFITDEMPDDPLRAARACPGNVPSTAIFLPDLNPRSLGALLALYEHRVFFESILYRVNPFDQFGVELGKRLARPLKETLAHNAPLPADSDSAVKAQVDWLRKQMG